MAIPFDCCNRVHVALGLSNSSSILFWQHFSHAISDITPCPGPQGRSANPKSPPVHTPIGVRISCGGGKIYSGIYKLCYQFLIMKITDIFKYFEDLKKCRYFQKIWRYLHMFEEICKFLIKLGGLPNGSVRGAVA